ETSKTPGQVAQEFDSFQQVLNTYDTGKQQFPNLPQHTENTNPNSTNPGSTKTAAGSPPLQPSEPPSTTVLTDTGTKGQVAGSLVPAALTISSGINVSSASPTSSSDITSTVFTGPATSLAPVAITNGGGTTNLPVV